ncbi:hypothetical protein [Herpetosiphon llansteffanensis]|uniref:hypothetical protein n=1 Tax=Herpetosiphon llansteffanensis TaxID=2094568 RepID=UPI000D7C6442|nr:hypothetical protein [Herpetosiphon llansteffanensis]
MLMPRCVPYQRVILATTPAQPSWRLKRLLLEYERYVRQIPNTERFAIVGMRLIPQPNHLLSLRDLAPRDGKFLAFEELAWAVQIIGQTLLAVLVEQQAAGRVITGLHCDITSCVVHPVDSSERHFVQATRTILARCFTDEHLFYIP